jgi:hypothetical protein
MNTSSSLPPFGSHVDYNTTAFHAVCNGNSEHDDDAADAVTSLVRRLGAQYQSYHGYASIVVCLLGVAMNLANVVVLTRPRMRRSPTNFLLSSLAVADLVTMTSYLPYAAYFYCVSTPDVTSAHARTSIVFLIVVTNLVITAHTAAIWLTVAVAVFRYLAVYGHRRGGGMDSTMSTSAWQILNVRRLRQVQLATAAVLLITALLCAPNYVLYRPVELSSMSRQLRAEVFDSDDDSTPANEATTIECQPTDAADGYWFTDNIFVTAHHKTINFWLYGVILKVRYNRPIIGVRAAVVVSVYISSEHISSRALMMHLAREGGCSATQPDQTQRDPTQSDPI